MSIILVRHGHALNHDVDDLRPLSDEGKRQAFQAGLFIDQLPVKPTKIIHSELVRAKETATLLASKLSYSPVIEEGSDLKPESSIGIWINNLMAIEETIVLVGHMPYMGKIASDMTKRSITFPTGGVVVISGEAGDWKLEDKNF